MLAPILAVFALSVIHWMKYQAASLFFAFFGIARLQVQLPEYDVPPAVVGGRGT